MIHINALELYVIIFKQLNYCLNQEFNSSVVNRFFVIRFNHSKLYTYHETLLLIRLYLLELSGIRITLIVFILYITFHCSYLCELLLQRTKLVNIRVIQHMLSMYIFNNFVIGTLQISWISKLGYMFPRSDFLDDHLCQPVPVYSIVSPTEFYFLQQSSTVLCYLQS